MQHNVILFSNYKYLVKFSKLMNTFCENFVMRETNKCLIFMPAFMMLDVEVVFENSRTERIFAHQNLPELWGRSWKFMI